MKRLPVRMVFLLVLFFSVALPHPGWPAGKLTTVKVTLANPIFNPGLAFLWVGSFLGYYEREGVDARFVGSQGEPQALGWVVAGQTHLAFPRPVPVLFRLARGEDMGVVGVYLLNRDPIYEGVAVPPASPIKSLCDLKGKRVGILSPNDGGIAFVARALRDCGLKPSDVTFLPTGVADKSAGAMKMGRIDAWASVDVQYALAEAQGFRFRVVPYGRWLDDLFDNVVWVRRDFLRTNRKAVVGFLRGLAKGSVFFYTNPDAALQIHWVLYPESVPKGISKGEADRRFRKVLLSRAPKLRADDEKVKKFGAFSGEEWAAYVRFLGLEDKLSTDKVRSIWTNELVEEVNNFDVKAIEEQARQFDFGKELKAYRARLARGGG